MAKLKCSNPEVVVKRAFWLAWQACGGPLGAGFLQDNPRATEDDVWDNVRSAGDYPGGKAIMSVGAPGEAYGDYVFGRMMKLFLKWDADGVEFSGDGPRLDYQSWATVYPSYTQLVEAAVKSLAT